MTHLLKWLRYLGPNFLWEWLIVLPPLFTFLGIIFLFNGTEPAFRIGGAVLQFAGVGTVFWGVRTTRKEFGQIGGLELLAKRAKSFPKRPRDVTIAVGAATVGMTSGSARLLALKGFPEGSSVEKQLSLLLSWINESLKNIDQINGEIAGTKKDLAHQVAKERSDRSEAVTHLMRKLEGISTGGLSITVAATAWILAGMFMSTPSTELAKSPLAGHGLIAFFHPKPSISADANPPALGLGSQSRGQCCSLSRVIA